MNGEKIRITDIQMKFLMWVQINRLKNLIPIEKLTVRNVLTKKRYLKNGPRQIILNQVRDKYLKEYYYETKSDIQETGY